MRNSTPSHNRRNAIERPHEIRVDLSDDERKQLGQLAQKLDLNYSSAVRLAIKNLAEAK